VYRINVVRKQGIYAAQRQFTPEKWGKRLLPKSGADEKKKREHRDAKKGKGVEYRKGRGPSEGNFSQRFDASLEE
jgi:hypothetical protein